MRVNDGKINVLADQSFMARLVRFQNKAIELAEVMQLQLWPIPWFPESGGDIGENC